MILSQYSWTQSLDQTFIMSKQRNNNRNRNRNNNNNNSSSNSNNNNNNSRSNNNNNNNKSRARNQPQNPKPNKPKINNPSTTFTNTVNIPIALISWSQSPQAETFLDSINNTVKVEVSHIKIRFYPKFP